MSDAEVIHILLNGFITMGLVGATVMVGILLYFGIMAAIRELR